MSNVPYDPTHPVYDAGEYILIPVRGKFLVVDGEITSSEVELKSTHEGCCQEWIARVMLTPPE